MFLFDISFDVSDSALSDRIEDAVDYREVAACVREVSDGHRYNLVEALAAGVADAIVGRFPVDWVRVHARKPDLDVAGLTSARRLRSWNALGRNVRGVGRPPRGTLREPDVQVRGDRCLPVFFQTTRSARLPVRSLPASSVFRAAAPLANTVFADGLQRITPRFVAGVSVVTNVRPAGTMMR